MSRYDKPLLWTNLKELHQNNSAVILIFIACILVWQVQSLDLDSAFCRCETGPSLFRKPFVVLWNSPTEGCRVNFSVNIDLERFGILTNTNQTWDGEVVTVFYNAQLGLYPYFYEENLNSTYNGGLPQLTNITRHLSKATEHIIAKIPDPDFNGVSVIDWEGWRPLWDTNFGKKRIYQTKSIELVEKENVLKKKDDIASEAKRRFENAAKEIMESTIKLARKLRPKALWGFYGFPGCHGNITTGYRCTKENKQWNDDVQWLYESSTALFPSIYLMEEHVENRKFVAERLSEAFRASLRVVHKAKHNLPVFPYLRPLYLTRSHEFKMLNEDDLENAIGQAADLGCAGLILWGNHHDERTSKAICTRYKNYIKKKLGPYISLLTEELETCSKTKCFSNGRCIDRSIVPSGLMNYEHNVNRNSCNLVNNAHRAFSIENKSYSVTRPNTTMNESTGPLARQETKSGDPATRKNVTLVNKNNKIQLRNSKLKGENDTRISSKEAAKQKAQHSKTSSKQASLKHLLNSSPNKTHKKIPFDPYWNKNGIFGLNKVKYLQTNVDGKGHLISVNMSSKSKQLKDHGMITHMSHSVTEEIHAKRSHKAENSTSSHKNKNSNPDQLSSKDNQPQKPGYSTTISDDTSVRVPSVYIILITVTLGGALLMTVIYVAIYYAVNVRGRSHDHSYDYVCGSSDENPFSIDGSPWWHKNMDEEEKLLKSKDGIKLGVDKS